MGVNLLGARKLRQAQRIADDPLIDHGVVWSHHLSGRYALLVTSDHRHLIWDRKTNEIQPEDEPLTPLTSCRRRFGDVHHG